MAQPAQLNNQTLHGRKVKSSEYDYVVDGLLII